LLLFSLPYNKLRFFFTKKKAQICNLLQHDQGSSKYWLTMETNICPFSYPRDWLIWSRFVQFITSTITKFINLWTSKRIFNNLILFLIKKFVFLLVRGTQNTYILWCSILYVYILFRTTFQIRIKLESCINGSWVKI